MNEYSRVVKLTLLSLLILFSIKSFCMSAPYYSLKGTRAGYTKATLVSNISTFITALNFKPDNNEKTLRGIGLFTPIMYFYLSQVSMGPDLEISEYNRRASKCVNKEKVGDCRLLKIPTKEELEADIDHWRYMAKSGIYISGAINIAILSKIHDSSDDDSEKKLAMGSILVTLGMAIYDYDNVFSKKTPPWVDFSVLPKKVGKNILPSPTVSFRF